MITEDYVSFESAKLMKEKGFDGRTLLSYDKFGRMKNAIRPFFVDEDLAMPTLQMAMKWLRGKYSLEIYPYHNYDNSKWWYEIIKYPNSVAEYECGKDEELDTYEQACEAAIKYCLENLI